MSSPKQMGSGQGAPREGVTQQQVSQQQGSQPQAARREGDGKPASQMQGTQFTDWASI
jgi:hypothetical protein